MLVECSRCPAQDQGCEGCLVTALFEGVPLPLDAKERAGVGAFLQAGLVSRSQAETLVARRDAVPLSRRAVG